METFRENQGIICESKFFPVDRRKKKQILLPVVAMSTWANFDFNFLMFLLE